MHWDIQQPKMSERYAKPSAKALELMRDSINRSGQSTVRMDTGGQKSIRAGSPRLVTVQRLK
jgi:hypothetical protein